MKKNKRRKRLIILFMVLMIGAAAAMLSSRLGISGSGEQGGPRWDILAAEGLLLAGGLWSGSGCWRRGQKTFEKGRVFSCRLKTAPFIF